MKITLLCLVFLVPFVSCITGGYDYLGGNIRFPVSLRDELNHHICAGALIEYNFVLTAATCVKNKQPQDLTVVGGMRNLTDKNGTKCEINKIISKDPTGRNEVRNNIALLRLTKEVSHYSVHFDRISLEREGYVPPKEGKSCNFVGWGQKNHNERELINHLQIGYTKISSLSNCRRYNSDIDESNICTNDDESGLCGFDTGDPLVDTSGDYLWGIATAQHSCGGGDTNFDVYTRVDSHKEWILKVLKENTLTSTGTDHEPQIIVMGIVGIVLPMMFLNS